MPCELELTGLNELLTKLEELGKAGDKIINNALVKGSEPMLEHMRHTNLFSDRTGKLRDSIKVSGIKKRKAIKYVWIGDIDGECEYGWVVEFGSSKLTGTHFMSTAYRECREKSLQIIKEELVKGLLEVAKRA